jgi:hypothetical protein
MGVAVFYHCLFAIGSRVQSTLEPTRPPLTSGSLPAATGIVEAQVKALVESGLFARADRVFIGVSGGPECFELAGRLFAPLTAGPAGAGKRVVVNFHGLEARNENRTLLMLERFVDEVSLLDKSDWSICYHHSKGATHPPGEKQNTRWRACMQRHVIEGWQQCLDGLVRGYDMVGAHYLTPPSTAHGQRIFAGNFFWGSSRYLRTLPSLLERERLRLTGIDAIESRYEAEVYIGNTRRPPRVLDLHPRLDSFDDCKTVTPLEIKT